MATSEKAEETKSGGSAAVRGDKDVQAALKKCAVGLKAREVVEEFTVENGVPVLVRKKVTKRDIPPDIKAVKMLLDGDGGEAAVTDERLEAEKARLWKLIGGENE